MTNVERGEVSIRARGRVFTLKFSVNAAIAAQHESGKTLGELAVAAQRMDIDAVRLLVWIFIQKHHGDDFAEYDSVGDLIDDVDGGLEAVAAAIVELFKANKTEEKKGRPQRAQVKAIGAKGTSRGAASA